VTQGPDGSTAINGNSNLLVFYNGKPSALKGDELLQNTPASEIKKIELITSPSAKYDASGSGGIINLITKKSTLQGLNGDVQVAADQLGGYSSDLLLNYKYHNLSLFGGIDQNRRRTRADIDYVTSYLTDKSQFSKSGFQKSERINTGFRTGLDYQPSAAGKFSISANGGGLTINNNGNWETVTTNQSGSIPDQNMETDDNHKSGHYGGADVSYELKFDSLRKTLSFSALWNTLEYDDNYLNQIGDLTGTEKMKQSTVINRVHNNSQFNVDFSTPTGKTGTLEIGYQILQNNEDETYQSTISNPLPPVITNQETHFNEIIQAGYGTWQYKNNHLDIKAGLRAEDLNRQLTTLNSQYPLQRFNLYPTLNSSFKIDSIEEIHINYTRRTDQLKATQLDPLPRWYDFYNVQIGNPNLKNEITDKIALDYLANFPQLTLSNELFYYITADKIEMIHSVYQDRIIQNRYENTGTEKTLGFELNADWNTCSWLSLNQKIAFIDSKLDIRFDDVSQQKKYHQLYTETTADFRITQSTTMQVDFSYYGPQMTAQSSIDQFCIAGISFRQSFLNKKLTFNITGRDFLGMYKKVEHIQTNDFNQDITTFYKFPIRFSLSYKFNHYKRDNKRIAKTPVME
jgi:outer membrane receptor for ferrienterochelin and colicin